MFDFDQYLGFIAFFTILLIGFWLMIFLIGFVVPYWLGGNLIEFLKEKRDANKAKRKAYTKKPYGFSFVLYNFLIFA